MFRDESLDRLASFETVGDGPVMKDLVILIWIDDDRNEALSAECNGLFLGKTPFDCFEGDA